MAKSSKKYCLGGDGGEVSGQQHHAVQHWSFHLRLGHPEHEFIQIALKIFMRDVRINYANPAFQNSPIVIQRLRANLIDELSPFFV